mgnify:FL=1
MQAAKGIFYVGVNDHELDLFEGQYSVPNGMAYNSYVIMGEKIAVMDAVDRHFTDKWLKNLSAALQDNTPDYLIVQHMEPDHSAGIAAFCAAYPAAVVVANAKAFAMLDAFYGEDCCKNRLTVGEGETLPLGGHTLSFVFAPMVHWPEVMMTYDAETKTLFTADAFGKFGALDVEEDWACEARRYYFGIVGKYGAQVQSVLKKTAALAIDTICPLHGPVLSENLPYYLGLYQTWSSYGVETDGICIAYTSVYGSTESAVTLLAEKLRAAGHKVAVNDLARCDMAEAVEDAFRYGKLVLATTTYNAEIFPFMRTFIEHLTERNYQNRTVAFMENGAWAPTAAKTMHRMLENSKNLTFVEPTVTLRGGMNDVAAAAVEALARAL